MTQRKTPSTTPEGAKIEAESRSADGHAGDAGKSGHDRMSHTRAKTGEGAGGGKKQARSR